MKTEKEIRKLRDDLYSSAIYMRKRNEAGYPVVMTSVRLLDYVLNEEDNMDFKSTSIMLKKFDGDSILAGIKLEGYQVRRAKERGVM